MVARDDDAGNPGGSSIEEKTRKRPARRPRRDFSSRKRPGDDDEVDRFGFGEFSNLKQHTADFRRAVDAVQGPPGVPIGGVEDFHGLTLTQKISGGGAFHT